MPPDPEDRWTVGRLLTWTKDFLKKKGSESPRLDAEVLLASVLACERVRLYTQFEDEVDEQSPVEVPRPGQAAVGGVAGRLLGRPQGVLFVQLRRLSRRPDPSSRLRIRCCRGPGEAQGSGRPRGASMSAPARAAWPSPVRISITNGPVRRDRPQPRGARGSPERMPRRLGVADRVEFHRGGFARAGRRSSRRST